MRRLLSLSRSLIGKKIVMAVTGVILFLFVVAHLLGNLKVFEGADKFNAYAEGLRTVGAPFFGRGQLLWVVRIVLLLSVAAHAEVDHPRPFICRTRNEVHGLQQCHRIPELL